MEKVICEQKHMGSRAVVIVCRDRDAALRRFGVTQDEIGVCYTRTGRRFFNDRVLEREFLSSHSGSGDQVGYVGRACNRLAVHRCRTDAVVVEGAGFASPAVCADWGGCSRWSRSIDSSPADRQAARARNLRTDGPLRGTPGDGGAIHRGISPLLLDGSLIGGPKARALSSAWQARAWFTRTKTTCGT